MDVVDYGLRTMWTHRGRLGVPRLSDALATSERSLERQFRESVGVSLKRMIRLVRFLSTCRKLRGGACELVLGDNFVFCNNNSTFEPQEANPSGEVHKDWNIFSYDRNRSRFIARQFNIETFVNTFFIDPVASDDKRLVFVSESS
jgi:AraC-like DNA-binding protein